MHSLFEVLAHALIIKDLHDIMQSHYLKAKAEQLISSLGYLM
jgi:hypothetical protein